MHCLSHRSFVTNAFQVKNFMLIIPHPWYSLDIVPYYIGLFPKLKMQLKGRWFEVTGEIQMELQAVIVSFIPADFQNIYLETMHIYMSGDYFEDDSHYDV